MLRVGRLVTGLVLAMAIGLCGACTGPQGLTTVLADDLALVASAATQGYLVGLLDQSTD